MKINKLIQRKLTLSSTDTVKTFDDVKLSIIDQIQLFKVDTGEPRSVVIITSKLVGHKQVRT